jgi:MFS family permease
MATQLLSIGAILFSTALFLTGNGLLGTLAPVRAHMDGFAPFQIGIMGACYFAGFVVGCVAGPRLLARVGHVRTFSVAAAVLSAAVLLLPFWQAPPAWFLLRATTGLCIPCLFASLESWLNDRASNETRGRILSSYIVVNLSALIVGQWLLLLSPPEGPELFSVCAMAFALALVPVGLTRLPQPHVSALPRLQLARLFRISPVGVAGCVAVGLANGAFWTMAPVYAQARGFSARELALFMTAFIAGGALIQWPIGRFSDFVDRRWVIAGICMTAAVSGLLLTLFGAILPNGSDMFFALVFLQGAVMLPLYSLSIAHTNDRLPREDFIAASAGLLLINGLASIAGPLLVSLAMAAAGTHAFFLYMALVHSAMAFFAFTRIKSRDAAPAETRDAFAPTTPQSSPEVLALDPRGPEHGAPADLVSGT